MTVHASPDFDVAIIGGGPAGAATASYLARAGVRCVVFEHAIFPRAHVGESLVPASTRVFKDLDFLQTIEEAGFVRKYGAAWTASPAPQAPGKQQMSMNWDGLAPDCRAEISFQNQNYTYHVNRETFDLLLLKHAEKCGATIYEGVRVNRVHFDPDAPVRVEFGIGRKTFEVSAHMVVDASGRKTFLGNQLRLRVRDPVFDQFALHTWFDDYDRRAWAAAPGQEDYLFIHFVPVQNTWIWQIPISAGTTSIGVVTQRRNFAAAREERERFFWQTIAAREDLHAPLRKANQLRPLKEEGDYSYGMRQVCGERFVLVGDAARFVDPIFSTGVSIALNAARFVCPDILAALESGNFAAAAFRNYDAITHRGMRNWYEFISLYYRLNILFTYFINHVGHRLEMLKLLQGDVYDEDEPPVLKRMREAVSEVEHDDNHVWHALLNDLTNKAFQPSV